MARAPDPPGRVPPDPPLADEAVLLRVPRDDDAAAIAAACSDPEIARWVPVPVPYTPADARMFLEIVADGWARDEELVFAIEERAGGALAGMIGLHPGASAGRASVGYWLARDARGRGLATRAVRLVAGWAFTDSRLERLELMTLVGNDASGRVALRAGFRREGILRRYLPFRGATVDAVMYAMVREDDADADGDGVPDDPLARVSLFAGLAPAELGRIRAVTTEVSLPAGATVMAEGDPGDALYLVLDGNLAVTTRSGTGELPVTTVGPGTVQGEIAVLEGGARRATVRTLTPARLLRIGRDDLFDVMAREPAIIRSLAATVAGRLRALEASVQEQERLASLGTLAAGLAHELNNPAAAARSSAGRLLDALDEWDRASTALGAPAGAVGPGAAPLAAELLDALREEIARRVADPPLVDPLDAADRRDAVARLLGSLGLADPVEPAASLVALGWDGNQLDDLLVPFGTDEARLVVATWLAATALVRQLLAEVTLAAGRISEIVAAVREYTYLDRAPVQQVDVTSGIESTLVILRAKWKAGVAIERAYAPDLPVDRGARERAEPGLDEPGRQRHLRDGRDRPDLDRGPTRGRRRRRGRGDRRQRAGDPARGRGPRLRPVLHDQGGGSRDGPRPVHLAVDRGAPRRPHRGRARRVPAGRPSACRCRRACRWRCRPPRAVDRARRDHQHRRVDGPERPPTTSGPMMPPRGEGGARPGAPHGHRHLPVHRHRGVHAPGPRSRATAGRRSSTGTGRSSGPRSTPTRASRCRPRATASSWRSPGRRRRSRRRSPPSEPWPPSPGRPTGRSACGWGFTPARGSSTRMAPTSATTSTGRPASRPRRTAGRCSCRTRSGRWPAASLPAGVSLRDLGEHRLKDLRPEPLAQLVVEGLPADFPPVRSLDLRPNNLPTQLTSFVGRERELAAAASLLAGTRLLTLTGPGGTGKTRLSLQLAAAVADDHPDGVWFVPLEPLRDATLVLPAIARTLGAFQRPDEEALATRGGGRRRAADAPRPRQLRAGDRGRRRTSATCCGRARTSA